MTATGTVIEDESTADEEAKVEAGTFLWDLSATPAHCLTLADRGLADVLHHLISSWRRHSGRLVVSYFYLNLFFIINYKYQSLPKLKEQ